MRDIENNFRFLLLEVSKQLESTLAVLEDPDEVAIERIESRDDYIDNLKSLIGNLCYAKILNDQTVNQRMVNQMRSINIMATNLERLADHAVNIVRQTRYFKDPAFLKNYEYYSSFEEITGGLDLIYGSVFNRDLSGAFAICRVEAKLDRFYKERFDRIVGEMRGCQDPGDLITALFIFRYMERIGDALLNIGEAAIYGITGERLKIRQYNALRESLVAAGQEKSILDVQFSSIWGTRSGARIGRIAQPGQTGELFPDVIFKEGNRKKLLAECANIALWEDIWPGLAPRVVSQQTDGKGVTLLLECLGGITYQELVLFADDDTLQEALCRLEVTVSQIWERTKKPQEAKARFMAQCRKRLAEVYRLHPGFDQPALDFCGRRISTVGELLKACAAIEENLSAAFTVFIHGDFNTNNLIYNPKTQGVHYIDLHRSNETDYVQDVSVFLVSNLRLPVFEQKPRQRLSWVNQEFLRFARHFAKEHGDETFEARLCLGLARSLITSARFEFKKKFAKLMFMRGVFLLEKLRGHQGPLAEFRLPAAVL